MCKTRYISGHSAKSMAKKTTTERHKSTANYSSVDSLRRRDVDPSMSTTISPGTSLRTLLSRPPFTELLNRVVAEEGTEASSGLADRQNAAIRAVLSLGDRRPPPNSSLLSPTGPPGGSPPTTNCTLSSSDGEQEQQPEVLCRGYLSDRSMDLSEDRSIDDLSDEFSDDLLATMSSRR